MTPGIAGDTVEHIRELIDACGEADLILPIGGASVGDYDYMKAAFQEAGAEILFSGIAVRPGKPTWFARLGQQRVLGLPGNPASAFVCAQLFLRTLMVKTAGPANVFEAGTRNRHAESGIPGDLSACRIPAAGWPDRWSHRFKLPDQDSSLLRPLQTANCLIRRMPNAPACEADEPMECVKLD
jgi:molybdopterin molybdotransferase